MRVSTVSPRKNEEELITLFLQASWTRSGISQREKDITVGGATSVMLALVM